MRNATVCGLDGLIYNESKELMDTENIDNPNTSMNSEKLKDLLSDYRVSAGEALELCHAGVRVGHLVQILAGWNKRYGAWSS